MRQVRSSWTGKSIINTSPQEAGNNGISTVYQEVNLCPNLTVAENIFIGREPMKMGRIDWKTMNTQAQKILDNLELEIDATQGIGKLFRSDSADGGDRKSS